jgi:predicted O-methyltransferase YrrM
MLEKPHREAIEKLWKRKLDQDERGLPQSARHRNLEPDSAEFICALVSGCRFQRLMEVGGSSGISTIALAEAARRVNGRLISLEIEPVRQTEAKETISSLNLEPWVEFVLGDAGDLIPRYVDLDFVLIDCEKADYIRFFDMLRLSPEAIVVADNIISHDLKDYSAHVRARRDVESITLPIGKGLEVTHLQKIVG